MDAPARASTMAPTAESAVFACVLSLRIADFAAKPVAAQLDLREQLAALLARALDRTPAADRLVLDAGDGDDVVFLGGCEQALQAGHACDAAVRAAALPVGIALNAGPVKAVAAADGSPGVVGDGVAAAETAAGFAHGRLVATAAFRDACVRGAPDRTASFTPLGERTDGRLRAYELFECPVVPQAPAPARRRVLRAIAVGAGLAIAGGVLVRGARRRAAAERRPAIVKLDITPAAEIVVDGTPRGRTPPMRTLEIAPGKHTVEIRNSGFKPITLELDLKPGEETTVRHAFGNPPQPSAWQKLLRKLGQ